MARTYASVEIDEDARPRGWKLMRCPPSPAVELIRKLRQKGFFANHGSLRELEQDCVRLSKLADAEGSSKFMDASLHSKESSSGNKNCKTGQQSSLSKRVEEADDAHPPLDQHIKKPLVRPCSPRRGLPKGSVVNEWYLSVENGETVPIMEAPYADLDLSCASTAARAFYLSFVSEEQEKSCVAIEEWKLDLTPEGSLAIYVKTTKKVWARLGNPEVVYEQTIRSVLVYMQLFSMVVVDPEVTKLRLFQYLTTKFHDWKVKPNVSDLHESLIVMEKINLSCLYPLERRVMSRVMMEAGKTGELDADNGSEACTFKRIRRHTRARPQTEEVHGENVLDDSGMLKRSHTSKSESDEEYLTSKRQTRSTLGMPVIANNNDLNQGKLLSPTNTAGSEHVLLSSKLNNLKKRKANSQTREDVFMSDRRFKRDKKQRRDSESNEEECAASLLEGDSLNMGKAINSAASPCDDDHSFEITLYIDDAGGDIEVDNAKSRVLRIMKESSDDAQRGVKRGSEHEYLAEPLPAIRKLWDSTCAARQALDCLDKGGTLEEAQSICPKESLVNFTKNEIALREYGVAQFLPSINKQKEVAERVNYYAHDGDTVVEICSQAVDYLSFLKERLTNFGKLCNYKRYTVDQSQSLGVKDWMKSEGLPTGSKLLICLSLSFSLWGEQANKIVDYALEFKPKLIVVIAPLFSRRLEEHTSYNLIWVDRELLQTEILWPWGLMEVASTGVDNKKGVSPTFFLWSRADWTTKHRQIASRFGHLKKPVSSGLKG